MRDLVSCFSDYAVNVADHTTCSSYGISSGCIAPSSLVPSVLNAVTSLYKVTLSNQKQLMITVSWSKTQMSIDFRDTIKLSSFKFNVNSRLGFRKSKGSKTIESDNWKIEVCWDLSAARYLSGPEPVDGYHIMVMVDSELGLVLGDLAANKATDKEMINNNNFSSNHVAKVSLVARKEHCSGSTLYVTKAKFCESGSEHDILIRCGGDEEGLNYPVLYVSIDKKLVMSEKRLQWNFRGNQSIFVDGLLIDLMWDVHDWFFNRPNSCGYAVFMFRTRNGFDNRLWLEEKMLQADKVEFALLIHASKNS